MLISVSKLIEESYKFYSEHREIFFEYVKYLFLFFLGFFVIIFATGTTSAATASSGVTFFASVILMIILVVIFALSVSWVTLSIIKSAADTYQSAQPKTAKEQMAQTRSLILPSIWVAILTALANFGGFILLVIPAIIFGVWFSFATYALVIDNKRGTNALSTSKALVSGRWWSVAWRLLLLGLFFGILLSLIPEVISLPFELLSIVSKSSTGISTVIATAGKIMAMAVRIFLVPFPIAAHTIFYLELKKTPVQNQSNIASPNTSM